jgi:hypothetical protein
MSLRLNYNLKSEKLSKFGGYKDTGRRADDSEIPDETGTMKRCQFVETQSGYCFQVSPAKLWFVGIEEYV